MSRARRWVRGVRGVFINIDVITSRDIPRLWKIDVVYGKIGGNVEALAESA